ncbi:MAG TPA: hypothetical protein GXZ30_06160, partial [Propionibacterium sp.]|nr:hypothetical protein [Propionibacterium sp.]
MTHSVMVPPAEAQPETAATRPGVAEPVQGWDRVQVIHSLRAAAERQREAEVDQYALIAAAADVYAWIDNSAEAAEVYGGGTPRALHGERLWQFGAEGTPQAAEFITFEVGPALGISPESAAGLIADVLDLRHRLPRTWQLVLQGRVLGWLGRRIAQNTRTAHLPLEIALELDRHIAPFIEGWTPHQTLLRVAMLIARLDPTAPRNAAAPSSPPGSSRSPAARPAPPTCAANSTGPPGWRWTRPSTSSPTRSKPPG